jgi:hypothetical protein
MASSNGNQFDSDSEIEIWLLLLSFGVANPFFFLLSLLITMVLPVEKMEGRTAADFICIVASSLSTSTI